MESKTQRKYKVKPTQLQTKTAIKYAMQNKKSLSKAMSESGYAEASAKNPQLLSSSSGFIEALKEAGVTEEKLSKVLNEGLEATKVIVMGKESKESFVDIVPDHPTRHKFLETGLKVHSLIKDFEGKTVFNQVNIIGNSEESDIMRSKFTEFLEAETLD